MSTFLDQVLGAAARGATVVVRSNVSPPQRFRAEELLATPPDPSSAPLVLRILRPSFEVRDAQGNVLVRGAPGGEPLESGWLVALAVAVLLTVLVLALVTRC